MESQGVWGVTNAELEEAVAAVDPSAMLIPARIVRRVIKHVCGLPDSVLRVPHRKVFVLPRDEFFRIVDPVEVDVKSPAALPETLILLARPEPEQLSTITRPRVLMKYWRLLFHARVHQALERSIAEERLTAAVVQERIAKIGRIAFEEIRAVLKQEHLLLPPVDETSTYVEFMSVYLELKFFAPRLTADYFPSIRDWPTIDRLAADDLDAAALFAATRLPGCAESHEQTIEDEEVLFERNADPTATNPKKQSDRLYCRLMNMADAARVRGNDVRSSVLRWWAAQRIGPKLARTAREQGRDDLRHLADRAVVVAAIPEIDRDAWSELLLEMLPAAARGIWTPEFRFLYDLQKACVDYEHGVSELDVIGWIKSFGKMPLKRARPNQREVLVSRHLRSAQNRLPTLRITSASRKRLKGMLADSVEQAEHRLRHEFRPRIERALDEVGLKPTNRAEAVARAKLVEDLLDRVVERGFVHMGDLRDVISSNNLKLRDIHDANELWSGDEALRADRALARELDGVYRPGEAYRRLPQWLSSAAFGTRYGRLLMRYAVIPFGGAYVILKFVQHMLETIAKWSDAEPAVHLTDAPIVGLFGCFVIMLYSPAFRAGCWEVARAVGRLFVDLAGFPRRVMQMPFVRRIVDSRAYRLTRQFIFKPLVSTFVLGLILSTIRLRVLDWPAWIALFLFGNLLVNSRVGRAADEWATDLAVRYWHQVRMRILATSYQAIVEFFHESLEALERVLYAVDEWLRFRTGESRAATIVKAVMGFFWYFVNYVVRFVVTLLVEPQINPIKHFPVVTVSHKIILPMAPIFIEIFVDNLGFGVAQANAIVWSTIWLIPGVFGYLVWELKENWRLYDANRSPNLKPVVVGHHGESVVRLLRPAFHSGTIPKTFAKLRRADRKAFATAVWDGPRKYHKRLDDIRERVEHFVSREVVGLLDRSVYCRDLKLRTVKVRMGTNHLQISLSGDGDFAEPLVVVLEEKSYWLTSRTTLPGWFDRLSPEQVRTLQTALLGWQKMCGVELIYEQIEECFAPDVPTYDLCEAGLLVWPTKDAEAPVLYDLRNNPEGSQLVSPTVPCAMPTLDRQRLMFASAPIRWAQWVDLWEREGRRAAESTAVQLLAQPWSPPASRVG